MGNVRRTRQKQSLLTTVVAVSCVCLFLQQVSTNSFLSKVISIGTHGGSSPMAPIDANLRKWANGHSIAIDCPEFDPNDSKQMDYSRLLARRGNYLLFPRRAFLVPSGMPTPASWLKQHDIQSTILVSRQPDGNTLVTARTVSPETPSSPPSPPAWTSLRSQSPTEVWGIIFFVALIFVAGYLLISILGGDAPLALTEFFGLSLGLGLGAVGLSVLDLSLMGIVPDRVELLAIAVAVLLLLLFAARHGRLATLKWRSRSRFEGWRDLLLLIPLGLVLYVFVGVTIHALAFDIYDGDAFAIWGMKARVLLTYPLLPRPSFFTDPHFFYCHVRYPLLFPSILAGGYGSVGGFDDRAIKILLPLLVAPLPLLCFACLSSIGLSRLRACLLTALLVGMPALCRWAGSGNADVVLATFYFGGVVYLTRWLKTARWQDLFLCSAFTASAALTKNEGLPLAFFSGLIVAIRSITSPKRFALRAPFLYAGIAAAMIAPFFFWAHGLPHGDEDYLGQFTLARIIGNSDRTFSIVKAMAREMMDPQHQGGVWLVLPLAALLGYRGFGDFTIRSLWFLLLAQLGLYAVIYEISPWELESLLPISVDRLILHITPLAVLLIGLHWTRIGGSPDGMLQRDQAVHAITVPPVKTSIPPTATAGSEQ